MQSKNWLKIYLFNTTQRITNDTAVRCRCVVTYAHSLALDYNYRVVVLIISLLSTTFNEVQVNNDKVSLVTQQRT